ncbi:MAG: crossover junction endodeoxyribonuclease RuvC [Draconibacterium sp.]|nr:crossover junction endodeoxyribonuclease RuvC [Draconibacterium sp.]
MIIVGIDPGIRTTGFGVLKKNGKLSLLSCGTITPPTKETMAERLKYLYNDAMSIIDRYKPDLLTIESTFHQKNVKSALILGQAKGAILLAAANSKVPAFEYAPRKVKSAVTGNGSATKEQVQFMMKRILNIEDLSVKYDVSDALAVAYCGLTNIGIRQ